MPGKYDDIIHLSRPRYEDLPAMSRNERAGQFSSFAALVGYDDAVEETARLTESRMVLDESELEALDEALDRLLDRLDEQPLVSITYFVPDERKEGGRYTEKTGKVRIFDSYTRELVFTDQVRVGILDIVRIEIKEEEQ